MVTDPLTPACRPGLERGEGETERERARGPSGNPPEVVVCVWGGWVGGGAGRRADHRYYGMTLPF